MKMVKFPWTSKDKLYWHDDNYYITVSPEANKLRIDDIDIFEFHKRWGLAGLRGPFMILTNVRERLMNIIATGEPTILDGLFESAQRQEPRLDRPRFNAPGDE